MRAFEVYLNNKKLCVAGIGNDGVLTTNVVYVTGHGPAYCNLRVGGLLSPTSEHVTWRNQRLTVGDVVRVKIVESASVDRPRERHRRDPVQETKDLKRYVRKMAKKLGWKITTSRTPK
jgi:hypothetical protein